MEPDFSGWATKASITCTDGRTIMEDAFKHQDGMKVPLVYAHGHKDPENLLGYAILKHQNGGMRCDAFFNNSPKAQAAKEAVEHGDIDSLSIWANQLVEKAKQVFHGAIKEVSLVLSGANPGAKIDFVRFAHSDDPADDEISDDTAVITTGLTLEHADGSPIQPSEAKVEKTAQEIYDGLSEEEKEVVNHMLEVALETPVSHSEEKTPEELAAEQAAAEQKTPEELAAEQAAAKKAAEEAAAAVEDPAQENLNHQEGNQNMSRNVFDQTGNAVLKHDGTELTHEDLTNFAKAVYADCKSGSTFKEAYLAHEGEYGITNIDVLFPDAKAIDTKPEWITRRMEWVEVVLNGTRKLPFSKIKSLSADLTHEEARAKGYIKGEVKKEQFFEIAKRETHPKTIYKKQRLDRDDIIDMTDFDVVAWLWVEMRFMLREEVARAILVGDGREPDDVDKIDENKIRPIATDHSFYTDVLLVPTGTVGESLVEAVLRGREGYEGAGEPTAFMTQAVMTDMLLAKDKMGRRLYRTRAELASELEVDRIITVPVMKDATTSDGDLLVILVNLADYAVGSTRGGEITTFEDFDLDVNQHKYLIEGRMSGALHKHKTAQVVVRVAGTLVTPDVPTMDPATYVITIPAETGVIYRNKDTDATLNAGAQDPLDPGETLEVVAVPASGYNFPHNHDADWEYTRPSA